MEFPKLRQELSRFLERFSGSDVAWTQDSYTMGQAVDSRICCINAGARKAIMQPGSVNARKIFTECVQNEAVLLDGEMAEWLKAAVC
jgi:hypothetical protein